MFISLQTFKRRQIIAITCLRPISAYSLGWSAWAVSLGSLADCISVGLPTVSNDDLAEALDAPAYVERVPDRVSPVLIAEAIANRAG